MTKRSKSYRAAAEKIHAGELYSPLAAMRLAKETSVTKFDSTVEVVMRLGVDPRKADQMVRGTVSLPHGTGKTSRVLVFAVGERAQAADELLNISGIDTSFVLFPDQEGRVILSARSMGDVNVQVVLEKLGGGGNAATAGAQVPGKGVDEVNDMLLQAIDAYLEEE